MPLARRLALGSALGYLLAGVIIGPFVLALVGDDGEGVMRIAELGVVLMLFLIGLELNPAKLWRMRVSILGLGGAQVLLTAVVIAIAASLLGLSWQAAIAIGLTLSLSSTAMVLQTLDEKGWMKTQAGTGAFSVLLFQDIAVVPVLAILPLLAVSGVSLPEAPGGAAAGFDPWLQALLLIGMVAGIIVAGRFLIQPVFRWIAASRSSEVFIAAALALVVGITLAMEYVNLSPALGTFLAGVVLAESEYRHELEANIQPFKGLLLGLFFLSVGASIDFGLVLDSPVLILGLVALLVGIKFPVLLFLGKVFGLKLADNLMFAFVLAQGGEFAFLLLSYALQTRVLDYTLAHQMIVVVALSMVLTPAMVIVYERWVRPRFSLMAEVTSHDIMEDQQGPVIVAGYGRFGQIVSRMLMADGVEMTLLDHDASQIDLTARFGYKVFYGDARRLELLRAAGAARAKLLVVAFGNRERTVELVKTVRRHFPDLKILARAYDRAHAYELMAAGAHRVIRETFGSALLTGEEALKLLGNSEERAHRIMKLFQQHDESGLKKAYEFWGDDVAYGRHIRQELKELEKVLQDDQQDRAGHTPPR